MTITLTRLSDQSVAPACFVLSVDSARILLDCGLYDHPPSSPPSTSSSTPNTPTNTTQASAADVTAYLDKLAALAPTLDLVLLTHPLLSSVGLLPWLKARCGLRCPVYATLPTREMGRYAVQEWVEQRSAEERNAARSATRGAKASGGLRKEGEGARWAKKGKMIAQDSAAEAMDVEENTGGEVVAQAEDEGEREDVWARVWQLRMSEVRDAFLSVTAVRYTQPVHLQGASTLNPTCL